MSMCVCVLMCVWLWKLYLKNGYNDFDKILYHTFLGVRKKHWDTSYVWENSISLSFWYHYRSKHSNGNGGWNSYWVVEELEINKVSKLATLHPNFAILGEIIVTLARFGRKIDIQDFQCETYARLLIKEPRQIWRYLVKQLASIICRKFLEISNRSQDTWFNHSK